MIKNSHWCPKPINLIPSANVTHTNDDNNAKKSAYISNVQNDRLTI